jgi:hypothetical protein
MDCFEYERFFVKKSIRGYFERCLPSIQVKKKFIKKFENLGIHANSREKMRIWQHCKSTVYINKS